MAFKKLIRVSSATLLLVSASAFAGIGYIDGAKVTRVLTSESRLGGCIAELSKDIATVLPSCPRNLVTFSCTGELGNSRALANSNFQTAQLALVTGYDVRVRIRDNQTVNGFCYSDEISVSAPAP